ncbi:hypothetical protein L3Y34_006001 [Caenorhabditis briggsae]|uniref:Uncharacterized protein n=1 Tax=Caenorhabditis briggsae TaxID=6238 RepID=A0AAE8ZT44_CAEBR|nr:hypothetical protein L3Y34_006001 [Caenorhabditis briggsae]
MSTESYYPSYTLAGFWLAYPPLTFLMDANEKFGLFYAFVLLVLQTFCALKHVSSTVEQEENGPKLTRKQRIKILKAELITLLTCLMLQHCVASQIAEFSRRSPEHYSEHPFYWPYICLMFGLGVSSVLLTVFLAEHSISLFHPSDFLDSYQMIIFYIYVFMIARDEKNITERMYFVFYYHIIKGILIVFMDPSSFVDTCNESEMVIIKTWTGRKYRGHPKRQWLSILIIEFENLEECVEGKVWEKSKRHVLLGVQIMWMKRWHQNPEVFGLA